MPKKTAIITGATGFVGRAVLSELLRNDYKVYAVVREGKEHTLPHESNCVPVVCSLDNISSLKSEFTNCTIDVMYHFAWAGVSGAQRADINTQLVNAKWTVDAVLFAKDIGVKKMVCAGSIMEHELMSTAYTQGARPPLAYVYGAGKVAAHTMSKCIAASVGQDLIWATITNTYGVGEDSPRLINATLKKCLCNESPRFTSGTQRYDFVYIDDVARAFRLIGERGKPFNDYLIGSGNAKSLKEFLLEMQQEIAPEIPFIFGEIPYKGVDLPPEVYDCSQTERDTGFKASVSFGKGCRLTYDWLKEKVNK